MMSVIFLLVSRNRSQLTKSCLNCARQTTQGSHTADSQRYREHPSPLKRLPHKALSPTHTAAPVTTSHVTPSHTAPSHPRKRVPSAPVHQQTDNAPSAPLSRQRHLTVSGPAAVPLAAMSGVEGVRADKTPKGGRPGWPAVFVEAGCRVEDSRPNARVRSGVSHKTPSRVAAPPFARNDVSLRGEGDGCWPLRSGTGAACEAARRARPTKRPRDTNAAAKPHKA